MTTDRIDPTEAPSGLPRLAFVHIPKTAGLGLAYALQAIYGDDRTWRIGNEADVERFLAEPPGFVDRFRFVTGHIPTPTLLARTWTRWRMVSVVREPLERLLSAYNYIVGNAWHPQHDRVAALSPAEYLAESCDGPETNVQCDYFAADRTFASAREVLAERFSLVGRRESYAATLDALAALLGRPLAHPGRVNASDGPARAGDLPASLRARVRDAHREDYALFEFVSAGPGGIWRPPS